MRKKDTSDVMASCMAIAGDAASIFIGFMAAVWLRFESGLIPLFHDSPPPNLYGMYAKGAALATILFLFIFKALKLYERPQIGAFSDRIPRLLHGIVLGVILALAMAFGLRTDPPFSRIVVLTSVVSVSLCLLLQRYLLFKLELVLARRKSAINRVLIAGADQLAAHLKRAIDREPRLKSEVIGFLATQPTAPNSDIPSDLIKGTLADLKALIEPLHVDSSSTEKIVWMSVLKYRAIRNTSSREGL